ncbi:hypothetical protein JCGZ_16286 [Jatropha curcas]|uniref:Uncharacterized protein n=1 Tax=Jatropha curcas TaxID=180498 RepID=A0A067LB41_JATCU|nr:hypothetical protein JCGZ_16286 [Jatropha curcas]
MNCMLWTFYATPMVKPGCTLVIIIDGVGLALAAIYIGIFLLYAQRMKGKPKLVMKRRKISKASSQKGKYEAEEISHTEIQQSGPSFAHLPWHILVKILLRLSVKRIATCKCVCQAWKEQDQDFVLKISRQHRYINWKPGCDCKSDIKLDTKLKLPLRNLQLVLNDQIDDNGAKRNRCLRLKTKDHKYKIVNSCNGLLCLSLTSDNNPVAICNPVTGEFINLPAAKMVEDDDGIKDFIDCGLGFSPVTNQFKVIRVFKQAWNPSSSTLRVENYHDRLAEVHTLGTESWRDVGFAPNSIYKLAFPTYLNGAFHWFCLDGSNSDFEFHLTLKMSAFNQFHHLRQTLIDVP